MYVADYVLMEYGTGAIMAVPGHDERDFDFATEFGLPIRRVVGGGEELPYTGDGPLVNSSPEFDGLHNRDALEKIVDWLDREGKGHRSINYRLRDWLLSRQRYWGCPIPIVYCDEHGMVPGARGRTCRSCCPTSRTTRRRASSPLAAAEDWVNTTCPICGGPARRETDTMDTFVDSSWYFLRYTRRQQRRGGVGPEGPGPLDAGRPVRRRRRARDPAPDVRALLREGAGRPGPAGRPGAVQGAVHAGHDHPRRREDVQVQGQHDQPGRRTSSATARTPRAAYILFIGPPDQDADWSDEGVEGVHRFLARLWRLGTDVAEQTGQQPLLGPLEPPEGDDLELMRKAHWAIDKVTNDMAGRFAFNTAIAAVMELVNEAYRRRDDGQARRRCTSPRRRPPR